MVNSLKVAAIALFCSALCGCPAARTEVILVVDTDLRGPDGIDSIRIAVRDPDGVATMNSTAILGAGQPSLPRTLGLVLDGERTRLGPYTATVTGHRGGAPLVARTLRFDFQRGRTVSILVELLQSCRGVTCGADQTCAAGGCRGVQVSAEELTQWNGTPASRLDGTITDMDAGMPSDGGTRDAAMVDAARVDAGLRDAGGDAGSPPPVDAARSDAAPSDAFFEFPDAFFEFPDAFRERRDTGM